MFRDRVAWRRSERLGEGCKSMIPGRGDFGYVQGSWRRVRQGYKLDATCLLRNKELEWGELQLACNLALQKKRKPRKWLPYNDLPL
jgi:hypothetical protein